MEKSNPKTIGVFVGEDLLGDGILKYPFVEALRESFPKAHITWISGHKKSIFSSLLNPLVQGKINKVLDNQRVGTSWAELFSPKLPAFDLMINTHQSLKTILILKRLSHECFLSAPYKFLFSDLKPQDNRRAKHVTDRLLCLLKVLGKEISSSKACPIPEVFQKKVMPLFNSKKTYVFLAPGAGQKKKQWPLENFIVLAKEQVHQRRTPVFILGPQEEAWHTLLKKTVPEALFPLQEHPEFLKNPLYTGALALHSHCSIANDSGTAHLLGLAQTPMLSLFGPTSSDKLHPYGAKVSVLEAPDGEMARLNTESVIEAIETILKEKK